MEKKFVLIINKEIIDYCNLNNIEDVVGFSENLLNEGFMKLKYPKPINKIESTKNMVTKEEVKIKENKNIYEE